MRETSRGQGLAFLLLKERSSHLLHITFSGITNIYNKPSYMNSIVISVMEQKSHVTEKSYEKPKLQELRSQSRNSYHNFHNLHLDNNLPNTFPRLIYHLLCKPREVTHHCNLSNSIGFMNMSV